MSSPQSTVVIIVIKGWKSYFYDVLFYFETFIFCVAYLTHNTGLKGARSQI